MENLRKIALTAMAIPFIGLGIFLIRLYMFNLGPDDWGAIVTSRQVISVAYSDPSQAQSYRLLSYTTDDPKLKNVGEYKVAFRYGNSSGVVDLHYKTNKFDEVKVSKQEQ